MGRFCEARLLYYTKTCSNYIDKYLSDHVSQYTDWLIHDQYRYEWYAGLFYTEMAEVCIASYDDVNFTLAIAKLIEIGKQMIKSNNLYVNLLARSWWIRNIFKQSQANNCPYEFRFQLVKTFFEYGLFSACITKDVNWGCSVLGNNFKIDICTPPILLELCYEALSTSIEEFDRAYDLSIEILSKCCFYHKHHMGSYTNSKPLKCDFTMVRIHRLFSTTIDNHSKMKNENGKPFLSVYQLHLDRGYFRDLNASVRKYLSNQAMSDRQQKR